MRQGPPRLARAAELDRVLDPEAVKLRVLESYRSVGHLLDDEPVPAMLADVLCGDCPIVGATRGLLDLTGHDLRHVLGSNCRMLLRDVPDTAISKSARKNMRDFIRMCRLVGLEHIAEITALQPNSRLDGTTFMNFFMVGMVMVGGHPYLLGTQMFMGDGLFLRISNARLKEVTEIARARLQGLKRKLLPELMPAKCLGPLGVGRGDDLRIFSERLQDHCMLLNEELTVMRREPQELATNCLVFGRAPLRRCKAGLFFSVSVGDVIGSFEGLPILGFTRREPRDSPDLYPSVSRCLGQSVLVGACGEAFARDKHENLQIGFKKPSCDEIETWSLNPDVPAHRRKPPVAISPGDVLGCLYTYEGRIQFWHNSVRVLDFDVQRPIVPDADYYAVLDVCFAVYCLTILPERSPPWEASTPEPERTGSAESTGDAQELAAHPLGTACAPISEHEAVHHGAKLDAQVRRRLVTYSQARWSVLVAIADVPFAAFIADPREPNAPLFAVSEAFGRTTGHSRQDTVGASCLLLSQDCPVSRADLERLRRTVQTGEPFTGLLPSKKKNGEKFLNFLDLRGLRVGVSDASGESLWLLVGVPADVTDVPRDQLPTDHLGRLDEIIRRVSKEFSALGTSTTSDRACACVPTAAESPAPNPHVWSLLEAPEWIGADVVSAARQVKTTMAPRELTKAKVNFTKFLEVYCEKAENEIQAMRSRGETVPPKVVRQLDASSPSRRRRPLLEEKAAIETPPTLSLAFVAVSFVGNQACAAASLFGTCGKTEGVALGIVATAAFSLGIVMGIKN